MKEIKMHHIFNTVITFRVPNTMKERLETYANQQLMSVSDMCRVAAIDYLKKRDDDQNQAVANM
jgi:hypothetical protein